MAAIVAVVYWMAVASHDDTTYSAMSMQWTVVVALDGNRLDNSMGLPLKVNCCRFHCDKFHAMDSFEGAAVAHQDPIALSSANPKNNNFELKQCIFDRNLVTFVYVPVAVESILH